MEMETDLEEAKGSFWGDGINLHVDRSFVSKVFVLVENYSIK